MDPPRSDQCDKCHGQGLISEKKQFEIHVDKGMKDREKVVLRGEAGCTEKNALPGDVIFVLEQSDKEPRFERVGTDLIYEKSISLYEALGGAVFRITHLDGRVLEFKSEAGSVIKPDQWVCIEDEGMPVKGAPFNKGNMYIHFSVKFPESLTPQEVDKLRAVLPKPDEQMDDVAAEDLEEVNYRKIENIKQEL